MMGYNIIYSFIIMLSKHYFQYYNFIDRTNIKIIEEDLF